MYVCTYWWIFFACWSCLCPEKGRVRTENFDLWCVIKKSTYLCLTCHFRTSSVLTPPAHPHIYIHTVSFITVTSQIHEAQTSNGDSICCIGLPLPRLSLLPHLTRLPETRSSDELAQPRTSPWCSVLSICCFSFVYMTRDVKHHYLVFVLLIAEFIIKDIGGEDNKSIDIFRAGKGGHGVTGGRGGGRKASPKKSNAAMDHTPTFFSAASILFTGCIMFSLTSFNI